MDDALYFFWLANQATDIAVWGYFDVALIALCGSIASVIAAICKPEPLQRKWPLLFVPLLFPPVILGFGVAFHFTGPIGTAPEWPVDALNAIFWSQIPVAIILTVVFRRNVFVPLGVSTLLMWYSLGAAVMSTMSVTNVWL